ncbi:hypothetical protein M569_03617, partial [Genlisea aurea]
HGKRFSSTAPPESTTSISPSSEIVNDLSRLLSDYRNPHHDIESALAPFASLISSDIVEQVLKRCSNLGFSAQRFFRWARKSPGFLHSAESYQILVDILGRSRQFAFLWDFLMEVKMTEPHGIRPEIFWLIFRAYCRADLPEEAIRAFHKMTDFGIVPSVGDLDQLLFTFCKRRHVGHAQSFFDGIKGRRHLIPGLKTYSILIRGWGAAGEISNAKKLFDEMVESGLKPDLLSVNSMMDALCRGGKVSEAYDMLTGMNIRGPKPDAYSYSIFIHNSCQREDVHSIFNILDSMRRHTLTPNVFTYNHILRTLCKKCMIDEAYELLDEMVEEGSKPDTWSYNAILCFHCDRNEVNRALEVMSRMDRPDRHSFNMVFKMLIRVGRFDRVEQLWDSMEGRGFFPSVTTYSVMIHGLCRKRSKLESACKYLEMMIDDGIPPYHETCVLLRNKLIGFGFAEEVDVLADKMERSTSPEIREISCVMRG